MSDRLSLVGNASASASARRNLCRAAMST